MSSEDSKATVRRYYDEVFNQGKVDLLADLAVEDYVEHDPFPGQGDGRADLEARVRTILDAFSPLRFQVEDMIAEGDRVVVRWSETGTHTGPFMGMPPTGREYTMAGIDVHRLAGGRMAEHWHVVDLFALLQQLGAIPAPGGVPS
jgi:steroid delta-isomerase-like uncharacterized protein